MKNGNEKDDLCMTCINFLTSHALMTFASSLKCPPFSCLARERDARMNFDR